MDNAHVEFGISAELLCRVLDINADIEMNSRPLRMGFPSYPTPTSRSLAESYYPTARSIVKSVYELLQKPKPKDFTDFDIRKNSDQPDPTFTGPF